MQDRNTRLVGEERPLTARSVVASVLLGMRPPELSGQRLVRTAELFGLPAGTTRVALSRMVAAGELDSGEGRYRLAGPLLARQGRQEVSRRPAVGLWNGDWLVAVASTIGGRPAAQRVEARRAMAQARMGAWREGVWARPDNLGPAQARPQVGCTWLVTRLGDDAEVGDGGGGDGGAGGRGPVALARALWDLDQWAARAGALRGRMAESVGELEAGQTDVLAPCFVTAAAVVRHLQADPLLPDRLLPDGWPGVDLRADYDRYEAAYQGLLRIWLRGLER